MSKMNYLTTLAYLKAKNALSDFKNDERGIDGIVIAILLIAVAAIIILFFKDKLLVIVQNLMDKIQLIVSDDLNKTKT